MKRPLISFASALLALFAMAASTAAETRTEMPRTDGVKGGIADYVRARAADDLGELNIAAQGYAAALADNPGNIMLALRTFRQAIAAGDMPLAIKTARGLDSSGSLPPDGALLLFGDAIGRKDWKGARVLVDRIERERLFAFLVPVMRAWIAYGSHDGDPQSLLVTTGLSQLAANYAAEHRVLLMFATGDPVAAISALDALGLPAGTRATRLRVSAAATLAARHKRDIAMAVLTGDESAIVRARALLNDHRKLRGAINTATTGIAELLIRVASDVNREQAAPLALEFARIAASLAPDNSDTWLTTASLLAGGGDNQAAIDALGKIAADDPFIGTVRDARLTLLSRSGQSAQALDEATAATRAPTAVAGDWARLADLLDDAGRHGEAAMAYDRAIALTGGDKGPSEIVWPLLLQQGNALLQAGDWPAAKRAVKHALALAPDEPAVLNFLGYSQLEHGEDIAGASALIAKASALAPDDPAITDSLGWSWYVRGDLGKAIPLLEMAARGAPAESDINDHLGDAYWKAGRKREARYAWRAALVAATGSDADRIRAKIDYGNAGKP